MISGTLPAPLVGGWFKVRDEDRLSSHLFHKWAKACQLINNEAD